ncbi:kelch-like protein 24 [Saccoglossus kowalevskii]|uniref:Kelch-like protein 24-like n=1 Tax=Saccoglossus kowalevskii TaxID=10224 RepID=A0ABM0GMC0_SACKO|nr:PREDICTED: kelch-like protein 24-like [Saccoglossus kowalevskii]
MTNKNMEPIAVFKYKDASHPAFVLRGLNELRHQKKFTDVVLCAGEEEDEIICHRAVLALCSPYFNAMFSNGMQESRVETIMLKGIDPKSLGIIVEFLYTGCIDISEHNAQSILEAASLFQISSLESACSVFMKDHMDASNCLGILQFAYLHNLKELYEKAEMYSTVIFSEVTKYEEFLQLPGELLLKYLSKDLYTDNEEVVYEAAMQWVKYDIENRSKLMFDILNVLRLPFLSPTYLVEAGNNPLTSSEENLRLIEHAQKYQNMSFTELQKTSLFQCHPRNYKEAIIILGAESVDHMEIKHRTFMYDPQSKLKIQRQSPPFQKYEKVQTAASLGSNVMVRTNLGNAWLFLPHENTWTEVASPSQPRWHGKLVSCSNHVYLVGGYGLNRTILDKMEVYRPESDSWEIITTLPTPVVDWHHSVIACREKIFIFGSSSSDCDGIPDIQCYDILANEWSLQGHMRVRTQKIRAEALNGCIYTIGNMPYYNHIECFDVESSTWRTVKNLIESRHDFSTAVCNGKLYVFGGEKEGRYGSKCILNSVECYDPVEDRWNISDSSEHLLNMHTITILHPEFQPSHLTGPKQH